MDFIEWFGALSYKYKIFIAGNHDDCLYGANIDGLPENCFYLWKVKPKLHLFGHIHDAYGVETNENILFANTAILNEHYEITNEPILLEI